MQSSSTYALVLSLGLVACQPADKVVSSASPALGIDASVDASAAAPSAPPSSDPPEQLGPRDAGAVTAPNTDVDAGLCAEQVVQSQAVVPDVLIVLDRSGSMLNQGSNVDRWNPSVAALKAVTATLEDRARFGLMAFPGAAAASVGDQNNCSPGTLDVPLATQNASAVSAALDTLAPGGRTPTAATLEAAHQLLASQAQDPDAPGGPQLVLLVTDGQPNCSGASTWGEDPLAVDQTVQAIESLATDGVHTYVIGYDTQSDPALKGALDRMAAAGATGESAHLPVEDEASLVAALESVTRKNVGCSFLLDQAVEDPAYVLVQVDGAPLKLNGKNGWVLAPDQKGITVQGKTCSTLSGSGDHVLQIEVKCAPIVVY